MNKQKIMQKLKNRKVQVAIVIGVVGVVADALGMPISEKASDILQWLGNAYVEGGF